MTEVNLSISYQAVEGSFKSKNAKRRLKEELKKSYNLLENKEDFLLIPNDKTGYFTKFLNDFYKLDLVKNSDMNYTVEIIEDIEKKNEDIEKKNLDKQKKNLDKQKQNKIAIKNKLKNMKDMRSNTMGRKIRDMRKDVGDETIKKFLKAQQSMSGNPIPDPSEIMRNKEKYIEQFREYNNVIKNMKEQNPQAAAVLEGNDYHKYASAILEKLELD